MLIAWFQNDEEPLIVLPDGGDGSSEVTATLPQLASRLLAEMLIEKLGNLAERDGGLGQAIVEQVLRVRLAFIHL